MFKIEVRVNGLSEIDFCCATPIPSITLRQIDCHADIYAIEPETHTTEQNLTTTIKFVYSPASLRLLLCVDWDDHALKVCSTAPSMCNQSATRLSKSANGLERVGAGCCLESKNPCCNDRHSTCR